MSVEVKSFYTPNFTQKKRVGHNNTNTYRVLFEDAHFWPSNPINNAKKVEDYYTPPTSQIPTTLNVPYPKRDLRHNNPQPLNCGFLLHNARTLNEPLCTVNTYGVDQTKHWICHKTNEENRVKSEYSLDSTSRKDYKNWGSQLNYNSRHSSNPTINNKKLGSLLTHNSYDNDTHRVWNECMSYEHQYDSRKNPNYPIRGKRQGNFVWSRNLADQNQSPLTLTSSENECKQSDFSTTAKGSLPDYQHKFAFHRQFSPERYLTEMDDAVSRLIQPDSHKVYTRRHYDPFYTH